jgi:hypothetical protein
MGGGGGLFWMKNWERCGRDLREFFKTLSQKSAWKTENCEV